MEQVENRANEPPESTRGSKADRRSEHQAKIEAGGGNQQPLKDVGVTTKVRAPHAAGLVEMCKGALKALASHPLQPLATRTANAAPIGVHRHLRIAVVVPLPPSAVRLRHVRSQTAVLKVSVSSLW
jgi:hypothetical protein